MGNGPSGEDKQRGVSKPQAVPEQSATQLSDIVAGILLRHHEAWHQAFVAGKLPELVRADFTNLNLGAREALLLAQNRACCDAIGGCLEIPQLRTGALPLVQLAKIFTRKLDEEPHSITRACELLLSDPVSAPIGAVIVQATLYPHVVDQKAESELTAVTIAMKKALTPEAFANWQSIAAQSLLWGYRSPPLDGNPATYVSAVQLTKECFGAFEQPATLKRAVGVIREFVPVRGDGVTQVRSYPVPVELWDRFTHAAQQAIVRQLDMQGDLVPWMREVLGEVATELRGCSQSCSEYRSKKVSEGWRSNEYWETLTQSINSRFAEACSKFTAAARFFSLCVEHKLDDLPTPHSKNKLRGKLEQALGEDIVAATKWLCACLSESGFSVSCSTPLALAVTELIEKLELPLDISKERANDPDADSFYEEVLLGSFLHRLREGDIESAYNLRLFFPLEKSHIDRRDIVDQYVAENQTTVVPGVERAIRRLLAKEELGPAREKELDTLRSAILYFVAPETVRDNNPRFSRSIGVLIRRLIEYDSEQNNRGLCDGWGCIQAGRILLRFKKDPILQQEAARVALAGTNQNLLNVVSECIAQFNTGLIDGHERATIEALWQACRGFQEKIPVPNVLYMSGSERMKGCVEEAFKKWRGQTVADAPKEISFPSRLLSLSDPGGVGAGSRQSATEKQRMSSLAKARMAHRAQVLQEWETRLDYIGEGISAQEYRAHAKYLIRSVQGLVKNADSADNTPNQYQDTFAGLFIGLVRGGERLDSKERLKMAGHMGRLLSSRMGGFICADPLLRERAAQFFLSQAQEGLADKPDASITKILKSPYITELLDHWGFSSSL